MNKQQLPGWVYVGHLYFFLLIVLSIVFYKERILFNDSSYILFELINKLNIPDIDGRWGQRLTQYIPMFMARMGMPVDQLILGYSINSALYFYAVWLLITYWLRNTEISAVMLLVMLLFLGRSFFWPQSTFLQALAFLLLSYGIIKKLILARSFWVYLLAPLLLIFSINFHPLAFIPAVFIFVYEGLHYKVFKEFRYWLLGGAVVLGYVMKRYLVAATYYDADKTDFAFTIKNILNMGPLKGKDTILTSLVTEYYLWAVLFLLVMGMLLYNRHWLKAGLVFVSSLGIVLLTIGTLPGVTFQYHHYFETYLIPLGVMVAIPLVRLLKFHVPPQLSALLLIVVTGWAVINITSHGKDFTARLQWVENTVDDLQEQGHSKYIIQSNLVPHEQIIDNWALCFEMTLLSAIDGPDKVVTLFIHKDPEKILAKQKSNNEFFMFNLISYTNWYNKQYIQFPVEPYVELKEPLEY